MHDEEIVTLTAAAKPVAESRIHIRWMIRRDLPDVLRIEKESFEYLWTEEDFLQCLRQRNCIGMVVEQRLPDGEMPLVGFFLYELHKGRIHILNFAVAPSHRRQGVGLQMMEKLVAKMASHRRNKLTLAVRERNLDAQLFFKACGFSAEKVLRAYYEDSGEDAYHMTLTHTEDDDAD